MSIFDIHNNDYLIKTFGLKEKKYTANIYRNE